MLDHFVTFSLLSTDDRAKDTVIPSYPLPRL